MNTKTRWEVTARKGETVETSYYGSRREAERKAFEAMTWGWATTVTKA